MNAEINGCKKFLRLH